MKVFKGAKRVDLPISETITARRKHQILMDLVTCPMALRSNLKLILQIRTATLFGNPKVEFYDPGEFVVAEKMDTPSQFRCTYTFARLDVKKTAELIAFHVWLDNVHMSVKRFDQPLRVEDVIHPFYTAALDGIK